MPIAVSPYQPGDEQELLCRGLRPSDEREAWKAAAMRADEALARTIALSDMAAVIRVDGRAAAIFGVGRLDLLSGAGVPWLVAHPEFENPATAVPMVRILRRFINHWLTVFRRLENVADPRHEKALNMLRRLGFTMEERPVKGPLGHTLIHFWRESCA